MADKVGVATGNWSAASTWNSVSNTVTVDVAQQQIMVNNTDYYTQAFTAPNVVDDATGALLFITNVGAGGSVSVTLQEDSGGGFADTAATASISQADMHDESWMYWRYGSSYTYTQAAANAYRLRIRMTGATSATYLLEDSGGANIAYIATDDRSGTPGASDRCWIAGNNGTNDITVTMDGTQTIGNNSSAGTLPDERLLEFDLTICPNGTLDWDTTADGDLTVKGQIAVLSGGVMSMGTVATPMPAARTATLQLNPNGTSGRAGIMNFIGGSVIMQGAAKSSSTLWKTTYASGAGTAADPFIVDDAVDWDVDDEIWISPTTDNAANYNEGEFKFIKTKNSATSYVLADTAGGAESALSNTHSTDAIVVNLERNVIVKSTDSTKGIYITNLTTTDGLFDLDWARFTTLGSGSSLRLGLNIVTNSSTYGNVDYCVSYGSVRYSFLWQASKLERTYTGLVAVKEANSGAAVYGFYIRNQMANATFVDCYALHSDRGGFQIGESSSLTFTGCKAIGANQSGSGSTAPLTLFSSNVTFNNCEVHCSNFWGSWVASAVDVTFNNFLSGTKGDNDTDIYTTTGSYNKIVYNSSSFGSGTFVSNYTNQSGGSQLRFHRKDDTDDVHFWYTDAGIAQSTGAGLADTTVRTAGSLAVRFAPESASPGFTWSFKIPAISNKAVYVVGFIKKNATFGTDDVDIELFLPGSTVADDTFAMPDDTNWNTFNLSASYTGNYDAFATVKITAKTATAGAYMYLDDLYNGTNTITALDTWDEGQPSAIMFEQLGDAAAVWAVATSTLTTDGTTGKMHVDTNKLVDDNQALIIST